MTERPMRGALDDAGLDRALRDLSTAIAWPEAAPVGAPDIAVRVRARLVERRPRRIERGTPRPAPLPRAVVLAIIALIAVAAVAAAVGLGLPGLRLILGGAAGSPPPTASPSATAASGAPGARLGLGRAVTLDAARTLTGRPLLWPTDPSVGRPEAVYVDPTRNDQVSMVWAADADLPATEAAGVGLILMTFDGTLDRGYFTKLIDTGTTVEGVRVSGRAGYWIAGAPHYFFYESAAGPVDDTRRWVGDALIWSNGGTTYRLETSLGRDAAIRIAESLE
jgi:hypothetical protein